jgi:hypothetical protein
MSRQGLRGIGDAIKANTTEKSIDDLRAEGKKRVRVVSSDRVMAIIQAIVDDTINAEVGAITQRDRDRIVNDTKERFSQVLRMQQDLEQVVDDLRESLRAAELERDRARGEKTLLEAQLQATRRQEGEDDAVSRLVRDVTKLRDVVERSAHQPAALDEEALVRLVERLEARDAQATRRLATEFEDLRARFETVGRDAAAARDAAVEKAVQRVAAQKNEADAASAERLSRELRAVAERVATAVLNGLEERDAEDAGRRAAASMADAAQLTETMRGLQRSSAESRDSVLAEVGSLRKSLDDARTRAVPAEQIRGLEQRIAAGATESADAVARLAERMSALDGSLKSVRGELAHAVERAVAAGADASHADVASKIDGALAQMRGELAAINARAAENADRQNEAVEALREQFAMNATVQSGSLESTFKGALEQAIDKIERTMARATAKPIETTGEATEVLLSKIFDVPDVEMTSNLDQLDVEQRTSKATIAGSIGRLKEMNGRGKPDGK